jgi:CheY-like chemotaxis protein
MREILLVEDSDADAELVRRALGRLNIANPFRHLRDGVQALAYLIQVEQAAAIGPPLPAVLFLDLKLPGMDGFEILERIQERSTFAGMLRIVLSNIDDTKSIKRSYGLGAHSYLVKPFRDADLAELIAAFPGYWSFQSSGVNRAEKVTVSR